MRDRIYTARGAPARFLSPAEFEPDSVIRQLPTTRLERSRLGGAGARRRRATPSRAPPGSTTLNLPSLRTDVRSVRLFTTLSNFGLP